MNKIATAVSAGLFLISSAAEASHVYDFQIQLRNVGSGECKLSQSIIVCGKLKGEGFPTRLPADASENKTVLNGQSCGKAGAEVILKYTCGSEKILEMRLRAGIINKYYGHGFLEWAVLPNTNDVFVTETYSRKPHWDNVGKIEQHGALLKLTISH